MIAAELRGGNKPSLNEALGWIGSRVDDIYGANVGRLEDVWIDPGTGAPRWLLVKEGRFGGRTTLIPFEDATAGAGHVWVPYEREIVREAPEIEPGAPLTQQVEAALRSHYAANVPPAIAHAGSGAGAPTPPQEPPGTAAAATRRAGGAARGDRDPAIRDRWRPVRPAALVRSAPAAARGRGAAAHRVPAARARSAPTRPPRTARAAAPAARAAAGRPAAGDAARAPAASRAADRGPAASAAAEPVRLPAAAGAPAASARVRVSAAGLPAQQQQPYPPAPRPAPPQGWTQPQPTPPTAAAAESGKQPPPQQPPAPQPGPIEMLNSLSNSSQVHYVEIELSGELSIRGELRSVRVIPRDPGPGYGG